jgi:hypothetical protein
VLGHLGIDSQYWDNGPWQYSPHYNDPPGGCRQ